jgi:DNA repair exonuclease SbcCD ATPase subunit
MRENEKAMERNMETMLDAFQQKSTHNHDKMNELREDQKVFVKLGEQLMQQMKQQQTVIDKLSKRLEDKENTPPVIPKKNEREKHLCPNCKQTVFHKATNCPEINAEKRWPGWTTRL